MSTEQNLDNLAKQSNRIPDSVRRKMRHDRAVAEANAAKRTGRGFIEFAELTCTYGCTIRVQESSAACASHVWLFVDPPQEHPKMNPHLNVSQAKQLRDALDQYIFLAEQDTLSAPACDSEVQP